MITPDSHKAKTWKTQHAKEAILNVQACEGCHNYTNIEKKTLLDGEKDVNLYARDNSFCSGCHLRINSPHEEGWAFIHTFKIVREDAPRCLICHEVIYCSKCHEENLGPAFIGRRDRENGQ